MRHDRLELIDALRERLDRLHAADSHGSDEVVGTGCAAIDRLLPCGGLRRGTLVEWLATAPGSGAGILALTAARGASRQGGAVVVFDRHREFYPPAAHLLGIDLAGVLLVRAHSAADELWAMVQAMRCRGVAAVWGQIDSLSERAMRRLQLAAETGGTLGLLVRSARARGRSMWSDVQFGVEPRSATGGWRLRVSVLRCRGAAAGSAVEVEIDEATGAIHQADQETAIHHDTHPLYPAARLAHSVPVRRAARA